MILYHAIAIANVGNFTQMHAENPWETRNVQVAAAGYTTSKGQEYQENKRTLGKSFGQWLLRVNMNVHDSNTEQVQDNNNKKYTEAR